MPAIETLQAAAHEKQKHVAAWSDAYSATFTWMTPINVLLIGGAAVASGVAGGSNLHVLNKWQLDQQTAGALALLGAALTVLHAVLGCAAYRAECKRLVLVYSALADKYSDLDRIDKVADFDKRLSSLNAEFEREKTGAKCLPLTWHRPGALSGRD